MVASNFVVESFSVTQAIVLDGATTFQAAVATLQNEIYGVRSGSCTLNTSKFDNTGNNVILSTWNIADNATLTITAGYISFDVLSLLSGETVSSSGAAGAEIFGIDPWTEDSINQSARPVLLRMQSKNKAKQILGDSIMGFYAVEFSPIKFNGPTYHTGLEVSWEGSAGYSLTDELGAPMAKKSIMKLLAGPGLS